MIKSVGIDLAGEGEHKVRCLDEKAQMCDGFSFDTSRVGLAKLEGTDCVRAAKGGGEKRYYGVHWTSSAGEAGIYDTGVINPSYNNLTWFERADSIAGLKQIMQRGGEGTGAKHTDVAIIFDASNVPARPGGGGFRTVGPIQIRGDEGVGITWYRNSGVRQHTNRTAAYVRGGRSSY